MALQLGNDNQKRRSLPDDTLDSTDLTYREVLSNNEQVMRPINSRPSQDNSSHKGHMKARNLCIPDEKLYSGEVVEIADLRERSLSEGCNALPSIEGSPSPPDPALNQSASVNGTTHPGNSPQGTSAHYNGTSLQYTTSGMGTGVPHPNVTIPLISLPSNALNESGTYSEDPENYDGGVVEEIPIARRTLSHDSPSGPRGSIAETHEMLEPLVADGSAITKRTKIQANMSDFTGPYPHPNIATSGSELEPSSLCTIEQQYCGDIIDSESYAGANVETIEIAERSFHQNSRTPSMKLIAPRRKSNETEDNELHAMPENLPEANLTLMNSTSFTIFYNGTQLKFNSSSLPSNDTSRYFAVSSTLNRSWAEKKKPTIDYGSIVQGPVDDSRKQPMEGDGASVQSAANNPPKPASQQPVAIISHDLETAEPSDYLGGEVENVDQPKRSLVESPEPSWRILARYLSKFASRSRVWELRTRAEHLSGAVVDQLNIEKRSFLLEDSNPSLKTSAKNSSRVPDAPASQPASNNGSQHSNPSFQETAKSFMESNIPLRFVKSPKNYFDAVYLPILLAVIYRGLIEYFYAAMKMMEPFHILSRGGGAPVQDFLWINYLSANDNLAPFFAMFRGHWLMLWTALLSTTSQIISLVGSEMLSVYPSFYRTSSKKGIRGSGKSCFNQTIAIDD